MDLHQILFVIFAPVLEFSAIHPKVLRCLTLSLLWFWLTLSVSIWYGSIAVILCVWTALMTYIASMPRKEGSLPRYTGHLDVLLGRTFRASKPDPQMLANNNVSLVSFGRKMIIAYRSAETHFASASARITVATSTDLENWETIWQYSTGTDDLREVFLWEFNNRLFLYFCRLATKKHDFLAKGMSWTATRDLKVWTDPVAVGREGEITWDVKVHNGVAYKVGYVGTHYRVDCEVSVIFECSQDGEVWKPVGKNPIVYVGGVCEVSFAFTTQGDLVAVGRNEDGDHTGFGTQLFRASSNDLGSWTPLKVSLPYRLDSPRMVVMLDEVLVFARYAADPYEIMPKWMPFILRRLGNLLAYSNKPKSSAVYKIETPGKGEDNWPTDPVRLIRCFEDSFGDTGFFSLAKMCDDSGNWVVANYASPVHSHAPWFFGQVYATNIYVCRCLPISSDDNNLSCMDEEDDAITKRINEDYCTQLDVAQVLEKLTSEIQTGPTTIKDSTRRFCK
jgi:hypothetical protein